MDILVYLSGISWNFVILIFWFANRQEKIDEEFGFNEREDG
jgi:putative solute:sodium symporter small subunit